MQGNSQTGGNSSVGPAHPELHHHPDELPLTWRQMKIWLLSASGLMLGGYSFVSVGVALPLMVKDPSLSLTPWQTGAIAAAAVFGRMLGALIFGAIVDRYGRKIMYRLDPLIVALFSLATVFAPNPILIILFQLLAGMGTGGDYPICSAYVSEIMPKRIRSRMVAGVIACQAVGSVLAALLGFLLLWFKPEILTWHPILGSIAPIAFLIFLFRLPVPESPKWLEQKGRIPEAIQSLQKIFGSGVDFKLPQPTSTQPVVKSSWMELFGPAMRRRTFLTAIPWLCMDIAVYGVGIFTPVILIQLHMGSSFAEIQNPFIGKRLGAIEGSFFIDLFLVIGFLLGILFMGKVKRIPMQIIGFLCMACGLSLIGLGAYRGNDMLFILPGFILFNTMMNAGPNLSTYTIPSEVFPVRLRASGHGFATCCGKMGATCGVLFFPLLQSRIGLISTLGIVAGFAIIGATATWLFQVSPEDLSDPR